MLTIWEVTYGSLQMKYDLGVNYDDEGASTATSGDRVLQVCLDTDTVLWLGRLKITVYLGSVNSRRKRIAHCHIVQRHQTQITQPQGESIFCTGTNKIMSLTRLCCIVS